MISGKFGGLAAILLICTSEQKEHLQKGENEIANDKQSDVSDCSWGIIPYDKKDESKTTNHLEHNRKKVELSESFRLLGSELDQVVINDQSDKQNEK